MRVGELGEDFVVLQTSATGGNDDDDDDDDDDCLSE